MTNVFKDINFKVLLLKSNQIKYKYLAIKLTDRKFMILLAKRNFVILKRVSPPQQGIEPLISERGRNDANHYTM